MKTRIKVLILLVLFIGCKQNKENNQSNAQSIESQKGIEITLTKVINSPSYKSASLLLDSIKIKNKQNGYGEVNFNFNVSNYELGVITKSENTSILANSSKGQHIHFILDNQPYSAHYENRFTKEVQNGVHHLVAFLSRSYHESVKNNNSIVIKKLVVGENPQDELVQDINAPTLIYSRPKGKYVGKDANRILLDFFILNTELKENGNKVKATINNKVFMITDWTPYIISGLPFGEVSIKLELIDNQGANIDGPFNAVERKILLVKS